MPSAHWGGCPCRVLWGGGAGAPLIPSEPLGWRLHVAVAPLHLSLQAAPSPGLFHHSEVLHCFRRRWPLSSPRPSPSPSWETSCCHLTLWCLSCCVCNAILTGKEECGLISAGMRPLGCPPRGEGRGGDRDQACPSPGNSTGLWAWGQASGSPEPCPHPAAEALLQDGSHRGTGFPGSWGKGGKGGFLGKERTRCLFPSPGPSLDRRESQGAERGRD